jgi:hypothetical protein
MMVAAASWSLFVVKLDLLKLRAMGDVHDVASQLDTYFVVIHATSVACSAGLHVCSFCMFYLFS